MSDTQFIDGLRIYAPHERAPEYIIANGEIDGAALSAWLAQHPGKVRIVIKRGQSGKYYASMDTYKREERAPSKPVKDCPQPDHGGFEDDDPNSIPF